MTRFFVLVGGIGIGIICAIAAPSLTGQVRERLAAVPGLGWLEPESSSGHRYTRVQNRDQDLDESVSLVNLTDEQIAAAGIVIAEAADGRLQRKLQVPGTIVPDADRIGRVAVKLLGTVAELRKRLGDPVQKGEVVAVIESREVAEAKREFLSARLTHDLQKTLFARAKVLVETRIMAENEYLRQRNAFDDALVRLDAARQKLSALGLTEEETAALPQQSIDLLQRQELRAPISGRVAERRVDLGALVGREGQESELYVIVDLSEVWADLAVSPADLATIREGQEISIDGGRTGERAQAKIMFVSPQLDKDTRAARVVAVVSNPEFVWRPGSFITADIPLKQEAADVVVPKTALQVIGGHPVVFVRTGAGFAERVVKTGRDDDKNIEIVDGLAVGQRIAISNTFVLKAELGKADAEHEH
jgi:cobalt-zinc-cadmium efflux system membrane fusion protein